MIGIERNCFSSPWNENIFHVLTAMKGNVLIADGVVVHAKIAECGVTTVGYVIWEENRKKRKGHLLNLAVEVDYRRRGLGTTLAIHALDEMKSAGMKSCKLEVRESNIAAISLYEALGFHRIGREPEYYPEEDALIYAVKF
ncbi:MAG: ribosomal-protein-alanine N-acetyltransferase [Candidatus Thorarchaeota archaeon]|nr:ribosomal-protein-alanine N-acetyltransferase [Candidatus Thorarchaeota archaeon]